MEIDNNWTESMLYAFNGNTEMLQESLINDEANINYRDDLGRTALHLAAANNNLACVRVLLSFTTMDINSKDISGRTALVTAVLADNGEVVCELIKQKDCNANISDDDDFTALHYAVVKNQVEIVRCLLTASDITLPNCYGETPYHLITDNDTVRSLFDAHIQANGIVIPEIDIEKKNSLNQNNPPEIPKAIRYIPK